MFFEHLHKLHKLMKHTTHLHFKEGSSCQGNPLMYLLPGYTSITGTLHSHWVTSVTQLQIQKNLSQVTQPTLSHQQLFRQVAKYLVMNLF